MAPTSTHAFARRKGETRYLEKMEAQRGYEKGSSLGLAAEQAAAAGSAGGAGGSSDPGFTQEQLARATHATALIEERDEQITKVGGQRAACARRGGVLHVAVFLGVLHVHGAAQRAGWVGWQCGRVADGLNLKPRRTAHVRARAHAHTRRLWRPSQSWHRSCAT